MGITASGLGSSLDVNGIVSQLMAIEQQPLKKLDTQEVDYQAKLSAYGTLKSGLSSLQDATTSLTNTASFQTYKASPSDSSVLTTSANSTAVAGKYSVDITQLAKEQNLAGVGQLTTTDAIGSGTLSFDFGTIAGGALDATTGKYTGASFTSNGAGVRTVTIDGTSNSLGDIRDAINAANIGVTATIVNDGSATPYRMVLTSTSGAANSMKISVTGDQALADLMTQDPASAQQQITAIGQADTTSLIGDGVTTTTLSLDFGTISGGTLSGGVYTGATFTTNGSATQTVTIAGADTSLAGIRDAINNTAGIGVTASIADDGVGAGATRYRLVLTSNDSGAANSLKIAVSGDPALSTLLAYDPANDTGQQLSETITASGAGQKLAETITAQDAVIKVNGITATKSSNVITDVIHGVTLNLLKETTSTASVTVARDTSNIKTALDAFVKAYNDIAKPLKDLSTYNVTTKQAPVLNGDSAVLAILGQMRSVIGALPAGITGSFKALSQIGVAFQKDGSLAVDATKLQSAIDSNVADVSTIVATTGGKLKTLLDSQLGTSGALAAKTDGVNLRIKLLNDRRIKLNAQLVIKEQNYRKQYAALDALLGSMKTTSDALTSQLAGLPGATNSTNSG
ncbi:MAG: flagellar filament capping protein FliD [Sterolibacterium sp.]|jgi:flagellar hook-associated protein 2